MEKYLKMYFGSWWLPTAAAFAALGALLLHEVSIAAPILSNVLVVVLLLALLSILAAGVYQFATRAWRKGLLNLFLFAGAGAASVFCIMVLAFAVAFLGPSEDGFGQNIVIPPDMVLEEAKGEEVPEGLRAKDDEGAELAAVYARAGPASPGSSVSTDLDIMNRFVGANRRLLHRHLASSAKWHVTEEDGKVYAFRRFVSEGGRWANSLHGYYSKHDFDKWGDGHFQFRVILGLDGPVLDRPWRRVLTPATAGPGTMELNVQKSTNPGFESYLVLRSSGPALEIYEEAETLSRPFTTLALAKVRAELTALWESEAARNEGFDRNLMPRESVKRAAPELYLVGGMGIYLVYAYVNPGEEGHAYLKVFEATKNTPLSTSRIPQRSTEYTGWSDDPGEVFFYDTEITVYEGDWGVYYPARFELWFVPASGTPERKIIEKTFKIEGWQR